MRGPKKLVQETAEAFSHLTGELGTWNSAMTARTSLDGIRAFLRWAVDRKILRSYAELTPAVWNGWRTYCAETYSPATAGAYLRRLRLVAEVVPGLPERTREVIRWPMEYHERDQPSYTLDQFLAIRRAAYVVVRAAHERITANYALTMRPTEEWEPTKRLRADALHQVLREGVPADRAGYAALGAITAANAQAKGLARVLTVAVGAVDGVMVDADGSDVAKALSAWRAGPSSAGWRRRRCGDVAGSVIQSWPVSVTAMRAAFSSTIADFAAKAAVRACTARLLTARG